MDKERRISYIDAMRGFTMILVVYSHICHFCLGDSLIGYNRIFSCFVCRASSLSVGGFSSLLAGARSRPSFVISSWCR